MKSLIIFLSFILMCPIVFAEVNSEKTIIKELKRGEIPTKDGVYKVSINESLKPGFSGWEERTYKNGKLNGLTRVYINGLLDIETYYKDNEFHGLQRVYYRSGKLLGESNYVNGKGDGVAKGYYESGALKSQAEESMGKYITYTEFFENGELKLDMIFKNGKPFTKKEYNEEGNLIKELNQEEFLEQLNK